MPKNSKKTENNIISFEEHKKKREQNKDKKTLVSFSGSGITRRDITPEDYNSCVPYPLPDEVDALYFFSKQVEDELGKPAPLPLWTGETWQMFFDEIVFPYAEKVNLDPFDVFAVFLSKINGMKFIRDEEGVLTNLYLQPEEE